MLHFAPSKYNFDFLGHLAPLFPIHICIYLEISSVFTLYALSCTRSRRVLIVTSSSSRYLFDRKSMWTCVLVAAASKSNAAFRRTLRALSTLYLRKPSLHPPASLATESPKRGLARILRITAKYLGVLLSTRRNGR